VHKPVIEWVGLNSYVGSPVHINSGGSAGQECSCPVICRIYDISESSDFRVRAYRTVTQRNKMKRIAVK
jgi:hypothetical protein